MKWKPKEGGKYYFIRNLSKVDYYQYNSEVDVMIVASGNCFKTKKEATAMLKKIKKLLKEGK